MKKIISLLLALLMAFSVVTVAFAEGDAEGTAPETSDVAPDAPAEGDEGEDAEGALPDLGELNWILDLPFWTVKPALKFAKIAFTLIKVYLKVAKIFGLVDKDLGDMALEVIWDLIQKSESGETVEPESTTVAPETNEPVAA